MWYTVEAEGSYAFELQRGALAGSPTVENTVGAFLVDSLINLERLKAILQHIGLGTAAAYFAAHVASKEHIRIGDFGEVVAGRLLQDAEGVIQPVEKLRYRTSPDLPMNLTDVLCAKLESGEIVSLVFCEAKAGTTPPKGTLARDAYRQAYHDIEADEPQILFFAMDRLLENSEDTAYLQFHEAMHRTEPVPRALRLVFVFDSKAWRDGTMDDLNDAFAAEELPLAEDLICYVITRDELKAVIEGSYTEANRIVTDG